MGARSVSVPWCHEGFDGISLNTVLYLEWLGDERGIDEEVKTPVEFGFESLAMDTLHGLHCETWNGTTEWGTT